MEIKEIEIKDKLYPEELKKIVDPPKKLYVLGNEKILNSSNISIIGSRKCSQYGAQISKKFSKNLAERGICIVSGMAKGIDSNAHLGAIEARGKTIAVLGSGFNHIFPDKKVFNKILENDGVIITEYPKEVEVFPQGFIQRNRIVAGLSLGTLIIEAKDKSGTGITARYAKKYGRKIFCIPHTLEDKYGIGTNRLLKNGAILVTNVEDIIKYFENIEKNIPVLDKVVNVPEEYIKIYDQMIDGPIGANEISKKSKINIREVNTTLTMLELEGYIESLPGNYFKII